MNNIKISFDYDGTITQPHIAEVAKKLIAEGHEVWIVTSRFDNLKRLRYPDLKTNENLYNTAAELGIPMHRIGFTNQKPKWISLNEGGFAIHIDDDRKELDSLAYYDKVKGFDCNAENFEGKLYDYIDAIKNF